ncbi:hypothetical protein L204_105293 [Cryptococcus depauperatus]
MHLRNPLDQRYYDQRRGNASSLGTQSVSGQATSTGSCENRVPLSITDEGNVFTYAPGPSNTGGTQMFSEDEQRSRRVEDFLTKWDYPERLLTAAEREVISKRTDLATPADLTIMRELESKARRKQSRKRYNQKPAVKEAARLRVQKNRNKRLSAVAPLDSSCVENDSEINTLVPNSDYNPDETIGSTREGADGGLHSAPAALESLDTPPGPNNLDQPAGHTGYGNDDDPEQEDGNGGVLGSSVVSPD